jgi:hypothetical protein
LCYLGNEELVTCNEGNFLLNKLNGIAKLNAPPDSVKKTLLNGSFWKLAKIGQSPADGHCLLHSVITGLSEQLKPSLEITIATLLQLLLNELRNHVDWYLPFVENQSEKLLFEGYYQYANEKRYNTDFGDIVVNIVANALNINILIVTDRRGDNVQLITPSRREESAPPTILLQKDGDHYNAILPCANL